MQAWALADYLGALRGRPPWARLRIPDWLCRVVAHACDVVHFSPFSFGHWELLQHDNLPQPNRLPELLGRTPRALGHAVFEATHGTAPKYANLDKVNPGSVILSGEMMLRYMARPCAVVSGSSVARGGRTRA